MANNRSRIVLVLAGLGVLAMVIFLVLTGESDKQMGSVASTGTKATPSSRTANEPPPATEGSEPAGKKPVDEAVPPARHEQATHAIRIDQETRRALLAGILTRLNRESQASTDSAASQQAKTDQAAPGTLDAAYIQNQIGEIKPLLGECYEMALDKHAELSGKLIVEFTIAGDPELGGVIESSKIIGGDLEHDDILTECVRETMYALQLTAPKGGGRMTVKYPFNFKQKGQEQ